MHPIQKKLVELAQERNLGKLTLRAIGELVGDRSPQKIKHHLDQLEKKGLLRIDKGKGIIEKATQTRLTGLLRKAQLLAIPILGTASAGPARLFAAQNIEGYLRVSSTLIRHQSKHKLFALKVSGPSMNRCAIDGKNIDDGDYVVIDSEARDPKSGDVVLSVIDGLANIKRFFVDKANSQILLMSESTQNFAPIYIHQDDDYMINGKVIEVIKKPSTGVAKH